MEFCGITNICKSQELWCLQRIPIFWIPSAQNISKCKFIPKMQQTIEG